MDATAAVAARRWTLVAGGAALAAVAFVLLAVALARWVLRPLHELQSGMLAVSAGRRAQVPGGAGPRELRSLATSFNRMSDAVIEAFEQQRRLIADASHQLRNPMAALRLRMDILGDHVGDPGRGGYRLALAEMTRLEDLLDGMLSLASVESAATAAVAGTSDAHAVCEASAVLADRIDAWRPSAEQSGVNLTSPPPHGRVPVGCSESELAQLLDTVLDNAVKYAGPGATVTAAVATEVGNAVLTVTDDGPGVPAAELDKLTERFWRSPRHTDAPGTGLGLAIAKSLAGVRGGAMSVAPVRPHGLTVRFTLPLGEEGGA